MATKQGKFVWMIAGALLLGVGVFLMVPKPRETASPLQFLTKLNPKDGTPMDLDVTGFIQPVHAQNMEFKQAPAEVLSSLKKHLVAEQNWTLTEKPGRLVFRHPTDPHNVFLLFDNGVLYEGDSYPPGYRCRATFYSPVDSKP